MSPRWDHPAPPTPPARSEANGAALRNWWGTVPKKVGHHYDRRPNSAPLPVETAPHLRRNRAPLPVGISAPFRPESALGDTLRKQSPYVVLSDEVPKRFIHFDRVQFYRKSSHDVRRPH